MERRAGLALLRRALVGMACAAMLAAAVAPARAETLVTLDAALARSFPGARIERRVLALTPADVKRVEARAHARCETRLIAAYVAWRGDTLAGAAYTDRRVVRTREALLLTSIGGDTTISRIDVLAFFEPPDYLPPARWLDRIRGHGEPATLAPGRDLPSIAGATLTSRAVTESARLALAWHGLLLEQGLPKPHVPRAAQDPSEVR
jgi:hypothetical protein